MNDDLADVQKIMTQNIQEARHPHARTHAAPTHAIRGWTPVSVDAWVAVMLAVTWTLRGRGDRREH